MKLEEHIGVEYNNICIVGPLPPPVYGMSAVNAFMAEKMSSNGQVVKTINTSLPSLKRRWWDRLPRFKVFIKSWMALRRELECKRTSLVYMSLSGGYGLLGEALLAITVKHAGVDLVVHHHGYSYVDRVFIPLRLFLISCPSDTGHIVLCSKMGNQLHNLYPRISKICVLRNAAFLVDPLKVILPVSLKRIGYLSNLSTDKGIVGPSGGTSVLRPRNFS